MCTFFENVKDMYNSTALIPYQKKNFIVALNNRKLAGINVKLQGDYFEEN